MDVLPAHLNRDSFRDLLKGLVALEIIFDLPFGFPIDNIISLSKYLSLKLILLCLIQFVHAVKVRHKCNTKKIEVIKAISINTMVDCGVHYSNHSLLHMEYM